MIFLVWRSDLAGGRCEADCMWEGTRGWVMIESLQKPATLGPRMPPPSCIIGFMSPPPLFSSFHLPGPGSGQEIDHHFRVSHQKPAPKLLSRIVRRPASIWANPKFPKPGQSDPAMGGRTMGFGTSSTFNWALDNEIFSQEIQTWPTLMLCLGLLTDHHSDLVTTNES